ncbi:MAG: hypothetical protein LH606_10405 [Cytophagaceae bacterium]|nr:hypothetical protein [Cytophagaceae bacterium]
MKKIAFAFLTLVTGSANAQPVPAGAPLQLHPQNPHYFLFREKPTVLITSAEHYGAVLNLDFDYKTYLDELADKGLNYTRIFTGAYTESPGLGDFNIPNNTLGPKPNRFVAPWKRADADAYSRGYHRGGNKFDLDQWDEAYFNRLKDFVTEAGQRGIVVEVTFFTAHYSEDGWLSSPFHIFNNVNKIDSVAKDNAQTLHNGNLLDYQEKLVRKLVRELNGFDNVFFELQNEPWAEKGVIVERGLKQTDPVQPGAESWHQVIETASPASLDWQRKVASFVVEEEKALPKKHLIAQSISNFRHQITNPDPQVSIFHFHYGFPEAALENQGLNRAIGLDETGFNGTTDSVYRRQAWRFLLAGGALFNNLDYSFTTEDERGGTPSPKAPGGGSAALRSQLKVLKNFMNSLNFVALQPQRDWLRHTPTGTRTYTLAAATLAANRQYAVYFEGTATATGDVVLPAGKYREEWVNVLTGQIFQEFTRTHPAGLYELRGPAGKGEVALRLTKLEK